eukprot:scaffold22995_cov101-Skeletonema_marinoi.AAC.1
MGRWKLSIAIFTVEDTIWWMKELAAIPKWTSSGHLRRCSTANEELKSLSSAMYLNAIVTNHNGTLEAVDCHIHSGRYNMVDEGAGGHPKVDLIRSPTTL